MPSRRWYPGRKGKFVWDVVWDQIRLISGPCQLLEVKAVVRIGVDQVKRLLEADMLEDGGFLAKGRSWSAFAESGRGL